MTIHSKTFIHLFSFLTLSSGFCFARFYAEANFPILIGVVVAVLSVLLIAANSVMAETHDLINTTKPHAASIYKNSAGRYILEICRFPLVYRDDFYSESSAETKYKNILKEDGVAAVARSEAGLVKVLNTPKKVKKVDIAADAYAHVEAILKQYAPEKVEALNKIKEVFERKD